MTNGFKIFESDLRIEENFIVKFHQNSFPVKKSPNRLEWGFIGICTAGTADIDVDFCSLSYRKGHDIFGFSRTGDGSATSKRRFLFDVHFLLSSNASKCAVPFSSQI